MFPDDEVAAFNCALALLLRHALVDLYRPGTGRLAGCLSDSSPFLVMCALTVDLMSHESLLGCFRKGTNKKSTGNQPGYDSLDQM